MPNTMEQLKGLLSEELQGTIGKLWNTEQDRQFLAYNAEKVAKYVVLLKTAETDQSRREAQFNLDMLQVAIASYAHQKVMVAGQSAEDTARKVASLLIGLLVKTTKV